MSRETEKYGRYYWCVKVTEDVSPNREIYLMADRCEILPNGEIAFYRQESGGEKSINLALAPSKWYAVYAASLIDGAAVAVEHWKGEVVESK